MLINASSLSYQALNEAIRKGGIECRIEGCLGQRFIAAGMDSRRISIDGIPGNALGAYLNGANIEGILHPKPKSWVRQVRHGEQLSIHSPYNDGLTRFRILFN